MSKRKRINEEVKNIINEIDKNSLSELTPKKYAKVDGYADVIARNLRTLKPTQLRRFFDTVKRISRDLKSGNKGWKDIEAEFYLLNPKLAYAKGRDLIPAEFDELMKVCLRKITEGESNEEKEDFFGIFESFFVSIVAYHKYHYPKAR
jgi:CRISPR-associated protein Csm2